MQFSFNRGVKHTPYLSDMPLPVKHRYNLTSISSSFAACAHVLLGAAPPRLEEPLKPPHLGAIDDINKTIEAHKPYVAIMPTACLPLRLLQGVVLAFETHALL